MTAAPRIFEVELGDIIIFFDPRSPPDPGSGTSETPAVNRVAVVVGERHALFLSRNKFGFKTVESFPFGQVFKEEQNLVIRKSPFGAANMLIVEFFLNAQNNPNIFEAGMKALQASNLPLLIAGQLFPDPPVYRNDAEYLSAWEGLVARLLPFDVILTRDNESKLSRFIARFTHGPWSHTAIHVANGEIWESVTSGVRRVSIDVYKGRRYRVGVYRHVSAMENAVTAERAIEIASSHPFRPNSYNYAQAIRYGIKSFVGDHGHALVPNSMIYQGVYVPIALA